MSDASAVYLGVDVSKRSVDVCALSPEGVVLWTKCVPRTAAAISELVRGLPGPALAVLEATGGLERVPARALEATGVGVAVENPARVRHYALSRGLLEKSDRIDRRMLAEYGRERRPRPRRPPDLQWEALAQLHARREQLVRLRASERTRLRGETIELVRASLSKVIGCLCECIEEVEDELRARVYAAAELRERFELLRSAPGVGEVTALALLATMPELGSLARGEAAKLAGVAPLIKQSGRWRGRAMTQGGRRRARSALYMAVLTTVRRDAYFHDAYQGMVDRGKKKKVALIAMAHRLLSVLNQMLKQGRCYDPSLLAAANR